MTVTPPPDAKLRWEMDGELPRRVEGPDGTPLLWTEPHGERQRLALRLPDHRTIALVLEAADHPVLGRCDLVLGPRREALAHGTAVDWRRPTEIPALDRPGALPPGAGTAILNLLAWQAARAGSGPLRYRGPYPSRALWLTLQASFSVPDPRGAARFVADAEHRALAATREPVAVDFHPAPHVWSWPSPRVCIQRRDGIERVYVDGRAYERAAVGLRRLRSDGDHTIASVTLGLRPWIDVLRLDARGEPDADPRPLPPAPADLVGTPLPHAVVAILSEVLVAQAPRALAPAMARLLEARAIRWGDPGEALVRHHDGAFELHAAMVGALPTDPSALLGTLVELLELPVRRAAAAELAAAWASSPQALA